MIAKNCNREQVLVKTMYICQEGYNLTSDYDTFDNNWLGRRIREAIPIERKEALLNRYQIILADEGYLTDPKATKS